MVKRRNEFPEEGELVMATVKRVNPYSVFVSLDEYSGKEGMIHVSEVARKWVRDIRDWVKKGKKIVCKVMDVERDKNHISLSLKRVPDEKRNKRMQTWKRDQKGEKFLKKMAEEEGKTLDEIYKELGFEIQDNFKDILEAFEVALKNPELLIKRGVPEKWAKRMEKIAKENLTIKEIEVRKILNIRCLEPDGVEILKSAFIEAKKNFGVNVKYVSSPKYKVYLKSTDPRNGEKKLKEAENFIFNFKNIEKVQLNEKH